ncbi:ParB/RepB/Spo0J family partition protein [Embleya sp. NPDC020630]|uniref:ParB/RepB/Spo0J family partition protein n=1 Tax=Embleya sp. NPDC020630 TaxID=3363979 RepID=UPI0037B4653E
MAGQRTSLASLAGHKVEDVPGRDAPTLVHLALEIVTATPLNRRTDFGTDDEQRELGESMRRRQLQPIVVVSRVPYLKQFPEHTDRVGAATYVVINGERRYRSAKRVGLATIEAVIRDGLTASRKDLVDAVLTENLDRKTLNPIEEAAAVEVMVAEFGSARAVAEHRGKHETWVSQRRSLLRLSPEMQQLVISRAMPIEKARKLAKAIKDHDLDAEQQAQWWTDDRAGALRERDSPAIAAGAPPLVENLTAVKSGGSAARPRPEPDASSNGSRIPATRVPAVTPSSATNLTAVKSPDPQAGVLPWSSPEELDRILREKMTNDDRLDLAELLMLED